MWYFVIFMIGVSIGFLCGGFICNCGKANKENDAYVRGFIDGKAKKKVKIKKTQ